MSLIPRGDRVLARPVVEDEVNAAGIVLPESARRKTQRAVVVGVGGGDEVRDIRIGSVIVYAAYGGTPLDVDGDELLMFRDGDIIGVEA